MSESAEIARELGAISATLESMKDTQTRQTNSLENIDNRLRSVERKAALNGGVSGGVMSIAVALIAATFKNPT